MSLIPDFELGLWNAWILILPFFLIWLSGGIINKRKWEEPPPTKMDKKTQGYRKFVEVCLFLYPIFLPLKLGTNWFQYGFAVYLLGIIFVIIAELNFASTPVDKPVTKGVYSISRNPMYFGAFLVSIGTGISSASWLLLLLAIVFIILVNFEVISEERFCLKRYGESYQEYMNKTPRWIGIPKSEKRD
ncbi:MAG: methyltransferase family protein [Candidatus Heimdallarchaeota archaeon]